MVWEEVIVEVETLKQKPIEKIVHAAEKITEKVVEVIKWVEVEKIVQVPKEIIRTVEVFVETL